MIRVIQGARLRKPTHSINRHWQRTRTTEVEHFHGPNATQDVRASARCLPQYPNYTSSLLLLEVRGIYSRSCITNAEFIGNLFVCRIQQRPAPANQNSEQFPCRTCSTLSTGILCVCDIELRGPRAKDHPHQQPSIANYASGTHGAKAKGHREGDKREDTNDFPTA